jgi:hypothetical protein
MISSAILYYILGFLTGFLLILPTMLMYKRTIVFKNKIIDDLLIEKDSYNEKS